MNPAKLPNKNGIDLAEPTPSSNPVSIASPTNYHAAYAAVKQLHGLRRWLCWRIGAPDSKGSLPKSPVNPETGYPAACDNPDTWVDHDVAAAAVAAGQYDSVGFVLGKDVRVVVVDLDKVVAKPGDEWPRWTLDIIEELDSYTEVSASGRGFHVVAFGTVPSNLNKQKLHVEIHGHDKMFAFTGQVFDGRDRVNERQDELTKIHARIEAGKIGPDHKPSIIVEKYNSAKFTALCADDLAPVDGDRSRGVHSVLCTLALKHNFDADKMRDEFERTAICAAWAIKWERLGDREIERAVEYMRSKVANEPNIVEEPVVEVPKDTVPRLELLRRDYIDDLATELTKGTFIPFNFTREHLKAALLASLPNERPVLPWFTEMHTRSYVALVSPHPESGKGMSYRRVMQVLRATHTEGTVIEQSIFDAGKLREVEGETLGSAEYAVRKLGGSKLSAEGGFTTSNGHRHIVNYDEGAKLLQKDGSGEGGRGLVIMFTSLFEKNSYAAGSLKNGEWSVSEANATLFMAFVNDSFYKSLAGAGYAKDGFLSRCVIVADYKNPVEGDWPAINQQRVAELLAKLNECRQRAELPEDAAAAEARFAFYRHLETLDPQFASRLRPLFAQDLYARALFSPEGRITAKVVELARKWAEHQYQTRVVLWPADVSKDKVETMAAQMTAAYEKHGRLSLTQAKKFANVGRAGSGGPQAFMYAHRALMSTGTIRLVGATQRGVQVFEYAEDGRGQ